MSRRPTCRPGQCRDELMRGGKRARCSICQTEFPCAHDCDHYDCRVVRGDSCPEAGDWYDPNNPVPVTEMMSKQ